MAFNVGDKVVVVESEVTEYEAGFEGEVIAVLPEEDVDDYRVHVTKRVYSDLEHVARVQQITAVVFGDDLNYPESALALR